MLQIFRKSADAVVVKVQKYCVPGWRLTSRESYTAFPCLVQANQFEQVSEVQKSLDDYKSKG
jgi:hypothetical protein